MKKIKISQKIFLAAFAFAAFASLPSCVYAAAMKLPYGREQSFVVVQGYDSPPTHIKNDEFAIDFSQNGCDAYGKFAVAAEAGIVTLAKQNGYNGGYGTEVMIDHGGGIVTRYAHLISDSLAVMQNEPVSQGAMLGGIGNTGLVAGLACRTHPGTHIHFALDHRASDGSYVPLKPEPLSGYVNIKEGQWYLSDNGPGYSAQTASSEAATNNAGAAAAATKPSDDEGGAASSGISGTAPQGFALGASSSSPPSSTINSISPIFLMGGGGASPTPIAVASASGSSPSAPDDSTDASSSGAGFSINRGVSSSSMSSTPSFPPLQPASGSDEFSIFNSSTLAVDFAWQPVQDAASSVSYNIFDMSASESGGQSSSLIWSGTSTQFSYPIPADGAQHTFGIQSVDAAGDTSSLATTSVAAPNWLSVSQPDDDAVSYPSWYGDNWYDLGSGFYGTIRSLTLEGHIDNPLYGLSHLSLGEFLDASYTALNQTFPISDDAPFTATSSIITMRGLNIPLQPNKYYRLNTYQDYQNRSVILCGSSATGTAMYDEFISGQGGVTSLYSFYPYLAWTFVPNYPALQPPNPVSNIAIRFDAADSEITASWPAATDPDTTSSLLTYETNISTSSDFDSNAWHSVGGDLSVTLPVSFGNTYTIGIRAADDLGNISAAATSSWTYPAYAVALPAQLDHSSLADGAPEKFHIALPTTISGVALWTQFHYGAYCCSESYVTLWADASGTPGTAIASTTGSFATISDSESYSFPADIHLDPGDYWLGPGIGDGWRTNPTTYFGSANDALYFQLQTADGP